MCSHNVGIGTPKTVLKINSSYSLTTSSKYLTFSYLFTNLRSILLYLSKKLFFVQNTLQRENTLRKRILLLYYASILST